MKIITIALAVALTACNNGNNKTTDAQQNNVPNDTSMAMQDTASTQTTATVSIKEIISTYLQLKNAFTKDNTNDAATAGTSLQTAFKNFDKTALTAQQKKVFEDVADDASEHAEHIGANGGNMLSKDMADLIKTFGNGGQTLYKDFCPMYNNNKGAYWISEAKEIKNPYLGKAMPTCGTMKEVMK